MPSRKPWRPTTKSPSIPAPARLLPPVPSNLKRLPKEPFLLPAVTHSAALICRYAIGCGRLPFKVCHSGSTGKPDDQPNSVPVQPCNGTKPLRSRVLRRTLSRLDYGSVDSARNVERQIIQTRLKCRA